MKSRIALAIVLFSFSATTLAAMSHCERKEQNIKRQLQYAQLHGNSYRIAGLDRALQKVRTYCTDENALADYRQDIADKREDVAERRQELAEAKAIGNAKKIAKRERKLAEAELELKELEALND